MTINLHGTQYVEVKDRVAAAHTEESYSMLKEETFSMGGREYVRVYIDVKGKQYIGTAECKFNANPKTPDGQSPFECGETSALGRALGFAGYGAVESIASADEVVRNQQQERATSNGHKAEQNDARPAGHQQNGKQHSYMEIWQLGKEHGEWSKPEEFTAFASAVLNRAVVQKEVAKLSQDDLAALYAALTEEQPAAETNGK